MYEPQPLKLEAVNPKPEGLPYAEANKPLELSYKKPLELSYKRPLELSSPKPSTAGSVASAVVLAALEPVAAELGQEFGENVKDAFQGEWNDAEEATLFGKLIPFEASGDELSAIAVEVVPEDLVLPTDAAGLSYEDGTELQDKTNADIEEEIGLSTPSTEWTDLSAYGGLNIYLYSRSSAKWGFYPSLSYRIYTEYVPALYENRTYFERVRCDGLTPGSVSISLSSVSVTSVGVCTTPQSEALQKEATVTVPKPNPVRSIGFPTPYFNESGEFDPLGGIEDLDLPSPFDFPDLTQQDLEESWQDLSEEFYPDTSPDELTDYSEVPEEDFVPRRNPLTGEIDETKPEVPYWALPDDEWLITPSPGYEFPGEDTTKEPPKVGVPYIPIGGIDPETIKPIIDIPELPTFPNIPPLVDPTECPPCVPPEPLGCDPCEKLDQVLAMLEALGPSDADLVNRIYAILGGDRWYPNDAGPNFDIDAEAAINVSRTNIYSDDEQEDTNTVTATDLITLLQINAAVQYQRSGFHRLPAVVPENLANDDPSNDPNIRIVDAMSWQEWLLKQLDQLMGAWPLNIKYKDAEGEESTIELANNSEALAEIYGLLLTSANELDVQTELSFKTVTEAIAAKVAATNAYDYAKANAEFLGYKGNSKDKEIALSITPGAKNLKDSLKEGKKKIARWKNEDSLDLVGLVSKVLFSAEIIKSVFYQQYDPDKGLYGEGLADRREETTGNEEDQWRAFLDELRNPTGVRYNDLNPRPDISNLAQEEVDED